MTRRRGATRRILAATALVMALITGLLTGTTTPAAAAAPCVATPFTAAFRSSLAKRYPSIRVTAAFYDTATGCWYHLNQGMQITTASVMKSQVLGAVLLKAQREGRALTAWERTRVERMIRYSFNPETSDLYLHVGSVAGMRATDADFGATATTHTATFGLTRSTAVDRTRVNLRLLHAGGPLTEASRDLAWKEMTSVHPLQRWGITAGVPDGWDVALKNGFYPSSGLGWRLGSSGFVRRPDSDQGYAATVMVEGAPNASTGIAIVEEVSRRGTAALTVGGAPSRPWDRRRCTAMRSGESWATAASRLGLSTTRAGEIRTIGGGNASPLGGQLACSPVIGAERTPSNSVVNRVYRPVAADLNGDGRTDLVWYAPGASADHIWWSEGVAFRSTPASIGGDRFPVVGDFDGDGADDIFWYGPGSRPDELWYGGPTIEVVPIDVPTAGLRPAAGDLDGDGRDDLLLYGPGAIPDEVRYGTPVRGAFDAVPVAVSGAYEPLIGDFDGNGADDTFWYGAGPGPEHLWSGEPGRRAVVSAPASRVAGRYRPVVGDVDGDGSDEILWYGPGTIADSRWDGVGPDRVSSPLTVKGSYQPLVGDVDGDGLADVFWYGHGVKPEAFWRGGPGPLVDAPIRLR